MVSKVSGLNHINCEKSYD